MAKYFRNRKYLEWKAEIIIIPTAMDMVRKIGKCGIGRKDILNWWKENQYGE